ncbi:MAG TPA: sugar transferase [Terriglobales bacterium]|nr:sugar transferase [Terriglobales bacterium]
MDAVRPNPAGVAAAPPASVPAAADALYPAWCQPRRLRAWRLRRGWRSGPSRGQRRLKRALDWLLCLLLGPPAALLVAAAALAVRCESPGSPFFAQSRLGAGGKSFRMWKLRTMVAGAAAMEKDLQHLNELPWPDFKISRDPRVTRVGRLLRRSSLDELPQIWNVVRGEMSWVGPRPTSFGLERYQLWHTERLALPPGITGLWQIRERAQCDFDRRLRLDLAYVRGWRLRLDLAILAATVGAVLGGRGAK